MITYKVWLTVEHCDDENDENTFDIDLPNCLGDFATEEEAREAVSGMEAYITANAEE